MKKLYIFFFFCLISNFIIFEKIKTSEVDGVNSSLDQLISEYDFHQKDNEQGDLVQLWGLRYQENLDEYNEVKNIVSKRSVSSMNLILNEVVEHIESLSECQDPYDNELSVMRQSQLIDVLSDFQELKLHLLIKIRTLKQQKKNKPQSLRMLLSEKR